jgi:diguanylate cyclase (GGDEF)-like protein
MDDEKIFSDIIGLCITIEEDISTIYEKLSKLSLDKKLKQFWKEMVERGLTHIDYYKKLLKFSDQTIFLHLFGNTTKIKEELNIHKKEIKKVLKSDLKKHNPFTTAYQVEYYLLHPVFETLYAFIKTFFSEISEKDSYYNQLNALHQKALKLQEKNLELSLLWKYLNEIIKKNKELTYQNFFDQSSGVLNIRGFFHNIRPLSFLAIRKKYNVGILIFDIDQFKKTFKEFPPLEREKIMRLIADRIKTHIRRSDLIGRYGDDKLILYLSDIKEDFFEEFAKKIKKSIESEKYLKIKITTSIGGVQSYISESPIKKIDYLFRSAEEALYLAKSSGKNKIVISKIIKT